MYFAPWGVAPSLFLREVIVILRLALTLFLTALPGFASALPVDWRETLSVSANAGPENPLVRFGFAPQPEPSAL